MRTARSKTDSAVTRARQSSTHALAEPDAKTQRILATVDSIPKGRVATYGQIAFEAGLPRRARLVGRVLRDLPARSKLPWHRVVNSAGRSSLTGASAREQRKRLAREGVPLERGRIDLLTYAWLPK